MSVRYRLAGVGDAALLAQLGARTFTETFGHLYTRENLEAFLLNHSEARWREELADPAFLVRLAEEEGVAAGYAKVGPPSLPFQVRGPTLELRQFYLLKPWHGTGVARSMMQWVLEVARERGAHELYLSVFVDNHRARRFYESYGFEHVGRYDFMVGSHADEDLIMRLKLEGGE